MRQLSNAIRRDHAGFIVLMLTAAPCLYFGWKLFWLLTDDSYILFRYVSNSLLGYGYVWNPPPFQPVEGYTSLLWVALLDAIWRTSGFEPPVSANYLSLLFSYMTLVLASAMLLKLEWSPLLRKYRLLFLSLYLASLLSNRTFLAWTSSGLETAMFCFLITAWVYALVYIRSTAYRVLWAATAAVAIELTRPDGVLYCAATVLVAVICAIRHRHRRGAEGRWWVLSAAIGLPVLVGLHFLWRHRIYGAWFPNTYYAKVDTPWPVSGAIYALSFTLEYGLWFSMLIVSWALVATLRKKKARLTEAGHRWMSSLVSECHRCGRYGFSAVAFLTLAAHFAYYTVVVGGDHFEYRVYNHFVPLIPLALLWSLNHLGVKPAIALILLFTQTILSLPVQWTHWARTRNLETRAETFAMCVPTATAWPRPLSWYFRAFDKTQSWLINHFVCVRHQEHKMFGLAQRAEYPSRTAGMKISNAGYPVLAVRAVGVPSWVLPHVYILDGLGLNDYVVARTPIHERRHRVMAHSRRPPKGYIECFRPNVLVRNGEVEVLERNEPLTETKVHQMESYWRSYMESRSDIERSRPIPTGDERILLIDDDQLHAKRGKLLLEQAGYDVVLSVNGAEALELIREDPDSFDLAITDMTMSEMDGRGFAGELSEIRPGIPVILCAQFSEYPIVMKRAAPDFRDFIIKPFEIEDLSTVRRVLDEAGEGSGR